MFLFTLLGFWVSNEHQGSQQVRKRVLEAGQQQINKPWRRAIRILCSNSCNLRSRCVISPQDNTTVSSHTRHHTHTAVETGMALWPPAASQQHAASSQLLLAIKFSAESLPRSNPPHSCCCYKNNCSHPSFFGRHTYIHTLYVHDLESRIYTTKGKPAPL